MKTFNDWCRIASLLCCLILGIEGVLFVHDLAAQTRSLTPRMTAAIDAPSPTLIHKVRGHEIGV